MLGSYDHKQGTVTHQGDYTGRHADDFLLTQSFVLLYSRSLFSLRAGVRKGEGFD